ncbi:MAG: response regulator, partial [Bryobacteraceae bacterium]
DFSVLIDGYVPLSARGDAGRLCQVLLNLASNAIKFTERGAVTIHVRLDLNQPVAAGHLVRFEVTDTGIGISEEVQKVLFQPFVQADVSTTRRFGGTGLGLSISRRLVMLMGGEIGLRSHAGDGSTFWFSLPLAATDFPAPASRMIEGRRALVLTGGDGDWMTLQHYAGVWAMEAARCQGLEGVARELDTALACGNPYDVALIDSRYLTADYVHLFGRRQTRFILITSLGDRLRAQQAVQEGFACYIARPFKPSVILKQICFALGVGEAGIQKAPGKSECAHARDGRILVAEDNKVNQQLMRKLLEKRGVRVEIVGTGQEAAEALSGGHFSLVLMDCQMPEMDGYAATALIRRLEGNARHTPVIALTANAMKDDAGKCFAAGMDDYLSKPINVRELDQVLQRWAAV